MKDFQIMIITNNNDNDNDDDDYNPHLQQRFNNIKLQ